MDIIISLTLVLFSTLVIAKACDGFEAAADYLGRNLSEGVKGASINAVGSSMPELFATFVFLFIFADASGFAGGIGTTAGSAVFNTMIIPAVSIIAALKWFNLRNITVSTKVLLRDGLMLIAVEFILIVTIGSKLEWWHGLMLMLLYLGYAGYMFTSMPKSSNDDDDDDDDDDDGEKQTGSRMLAFLKVDIEYAVIGSQSLTTGNSWLVLSIATTFIAAACFLLVYACEMFGAAVGIHGYFVAVVLAAAASSVPDTILSVKDAKKGNYDDAVSNALGSNIFDICFALGLPLFLYTLLNGPIIMPDAMVENVSELRILLLILTVAAFLIFMAGNKMGKTKAGLLLTLYILFTGYIVAKAYDVEWIEPISLELHAIQKVLQ
jgi:cation:H+ antiporter